jgi:hypothetical protein
MFVLRLRQFVVLTDDPRTRENKKDLESCEDQLKRLHKEFGYVYDLDFAFVSSGLHSIFKGQQAIWACRR